MMTVEEFRKEIAALRHKVIYFYEYEDYEEKTKGGVFGYTPNASRQRLKKDFLKNGRLGAGKYA